MEIPAKKWNEAIKARHSRRNFTENDLTSKDADMIKGICEAINASTEGVRAVFSDDNPEEAFGGIMGSHGKVIKPAAYVAIVGNPNNPNFYEKVGYVGECVVLEATSAGIDSCWIGGMFKPEKVKEQIEMKYDEVVPVVCALGYAKKEKGIVEKLMGSIVGSHKRKSMESICTGLRMDVWPNWVRGALEAARLAPSAVNRQPWKFEVGSDYIKVLVDSEKDTYSISKRLDCGIAMLHIEVGALANGVKGHWEYLESTGIAVFRPE